MARDRQSWYLSWGGRLSTSGEIWQTGLHLAPPAAATVLNDPGQTSVDFYAARIRAFHQAIESGIGFQAYLDWVRLSRQGTDGKDLGPAVVAEYTDGQPGGAGSTTTAIAYQLAAVFSLRSGNTFGTANYGRLYYPQPTYPIAANGHWAPGPDPLQNFRVMIDELNTHTLGGGADGVNVCNMSAVGAGTTKRVTEVRLGDVPDTQRRRRNGLVEVYDTEAIAV